MINYKNINEREYSREEIENSKRVNGQELWTWLNTLTAKVNRDNGMYQVVRGRVIAGDLKVADSFADNKGEVKCDLTAPHTEKVYIGAVRLCAERTGGPGGIFLRVSMRFSGIRITKGDWDNVAMSQLYDTDVTLFTSPYDNNLNATALQRLFERGFFPITRDDYNEQVRRYDEVMTNVINLIK